ncbi:VCBS repeat-containing protein [Alloacidobacterium dinghuense]|uniref:VCBS repeat-containing protein n=1 Tax=Alloacidobacterium dinghuense TaxID=2763107 RepID=A0A7G8BP09_9BACT|nr:VCBS repeat-containing protein [Alloacidobacterium dinghuense]QNI34279.1 VCBS repeat-containing protein [Alloacidobacterium dinghuense]
MIRSVFRLGLWKIVFIAVVALALMSPRAWASPLHEDEPDGASGLTVMADFNRDGIVDLAKATVSAGAGVLTVSLGRSDGTFQETEADIELGRAPRAMVTADFNQDGVPDVLVGDEDGSLKLFLGDGKGNLVAAGDVARLGSVVSIAVADFNRDGIPDIAVSDWRRSTVAVFLGTGKGAFEGGWPLPLRMPGTMPRISAADFNGDGIPDLAVVYGDDGDYTFDVFVGNGKGAFTKAPNLSYVKDPNAHCPA